MEPVHLEEALSHFDRVHLFAIQNKGYGSLQHAIESIINMLKALLFVQRNKQQF